MQRISKLLNLICILILSSTVYAGEPTIENGEITFQNGKILNYEISNENYENGSKPYAYSKQQSFAEEPILIRSWERLLIIRVTALYEDKLKSISVYDYSGRLTAPPQKFIGRALILTKSERVFLGQQSSHFLIKESILLGKNGELLTKIEQDPNIIQFDYSKDGKLIWIISSELCQQKLITKLKIIDYRGRVIETLFSDVQKEITIKYENRNYRIVLPQPMLPS